MRAGNRLVLCERGDELALARVALSDAGAGRGRILLVEGPPGIGKTSLLDAIAAMAIEDGFAIHRARGDDLESGFAYGVLRDLLAPALESLDPSIRATVLEGPTSILASIIEGRAAARPRPDELAIVHGLYRLMEDLSERRPSLLCVDDAHWADPPSLNALGYLARRVENIPVAIAMAYRVPLDAEQRRHFPRWESISTAERLTPGPLGEDAVRTLAETALGHEPDADLEARIWSTTGGNPFLVHELLATITSGEAASASIGQVSVEGLVPPAVAESVLRRIFAAGENAPKLAEAVAVLGEAKLVDAAKVAELDEAAVVAAADRLAAADVLARGPVLTFAHPLLREAVRAHIPAVRRAITHNRAARQLADRGAPLERIAPHLLEGAPRADEWVVKTLVAAAAEEERRGLPDTAVSLLFRAREEPPPPHMRHLVNFALAQAQALSGHPDAVTTAREVLADASAPKEKAEAALHLARTLGSSGDLWSALDLLDEGTHDELGIDPELALQLEAELLGVARLRSDVRDEALRRLDQLSAHALPPRPATRVLLANLALSALERGDPPDDVADLARMALADASIVDDMSFQLVYAMEALTWTDHLDDVGRTCDAAAAVARSNGALGQAALAQQWRSVVNLRRGAVQDAEADARFVYELAMGVSPDWRTPFVRATLADALLVRGELDEATQVLGSPGPEEEAQDNPFYLDSRGRLHLSLTDPTAALPDFLACGRALTRRGGVDAPASFPWRSQAALALVRLGDRGRAREMASDELSLAEKSQIPGVVAEALIALAIVEDGKAGIARLRAAVEVLDDSPRMLTRIRALTVLGGMLRRNQRAREARDHLKIALDLAHRHGAIALADDARRELIVAGGRPRRPATTGLDALTPSERRVAQLVAQGLTNRQIAHFLFVSPRTVTTHLTHIYQKIGISSRSELSSLLTEQ